MFALYNQLGLFFALVEKDVVDGNRVFELNRTNVDILRQTAARTDSKVAARGLAMAADMLDEYETTIRNMVREPAGAGHA